MVDVLDVLRAVVGGELADEVQEYAWCLGVPPEEALAQLIKRGIEGVHADCDLDEARLGGGEWRVLK